MKIEVEKVFQSPSTPVMELAYLVKVYDPDFEHKESHIIQYLERKSNPSTKEVTID